MVRQLPRQLTLPGIIHPNILPPQIWQELLQSGASLDHAINAVEWQIINNCEQNKSDFVIFIGQDWYDKYLCGRQYYRGFELRPVAANIIAIVPKYDPDRQPFFVIINGQPQLTIRSN